MGDTAIEWTDATWNPVAGCTVISPGCTNCYAMRMAARLATMPLKKYRGITRKTANRYVWNGKVKLDESSLNIPSSWKKPRRIFVNSMSDLFHEGVPGEFISRVWDVMASTPHHTYQILTKRPARMAKVVRNLSVLPNVWLGTSVENAKYLGRIDELRRVPASVRFVSFEPLLGSVAGASLTKIHWAIVGGESGPKSRPMQEAWVDEVLDICRRDKAEFFFKQWGGKNKKAAGRKYRGETHDAMPAFSM